MEDNCSYSMSLPVKPYVLKYVQTIEGSPEIRFDSHTMLSMIIRAYIENKNYVGIGQKKLITSASTRTAIIKVVVPLNQQYTIGTAIRLDNIVLINRFLESWFENALVSFMNENVRKCGRYKGYKEAYHAFASLYNLQLEKDITLEGLKKMDYRLRVKKNVLADEKNKIFFSAFVPSRGNAVPAIVT